MAITAEQQSAILKMTQAMFNATPGSDYLDSLTAEIESGVKIADLAQALSGTALFMNKDYSSSTNAADFADKFIQDLIGDSASESNKTIATDFIVARMNAGATQNQVIAEVTGILSGISHTDPTWGQAALHYDTTNVTKLVNNLLGNEVDAGSKSDAIDLLLSQMQNGATYGEMVVWAYTALDRIDHADPVWGDAAALLDNRMEVSNYYSVEKQGKSVNLDTLQKVLVDVTPDAASVETANKQIDELLKIDSPSSKIIDLANLNGTNGFALVNDVQFENLDSKSIISIGSAGDINGDGFGDVIVGTTAVIRTSSDINELGKNFGSSFVLFGKAGGFAATQSLTGVDGNNGVRLNGLRTSLGDAGGNPSVSSAGDINGDGIDDVVITAPFITDDGSSYSAATRVVFGKKTGWDAVIDLPGLNGTNGFSITSGSVGPVSNIGDFNGDGIDDLIMGAPNGMKVDPYAGSSYIVFGKADGFSATLDIETLLDGSNGFRLDGVDFSASLGNSVGVGDINGDGLGDIIVAAPLTGQSEPDPTTYAITSPGAAYVVFGKAGGVGATMTVDSLNGSNGFRLSGTGNNLVNTAVGKTGDINGDGFDDIILQVNTNPIGGDTEIISSYVVFGKAAGFDANIDLRSLNGSNGFMIKDGAASNAGDFNKDGFDDLIVGSSSGLDNYIVYGKNSGFAATIALDQLDAASAAVLKGSAGQARAAGDINKDGFDDVMLIGRTTDAAEAGQAYVVFGGPSS